MGNSYLKRIQSHLKNAFIYEKKKKAELDLTVSASIVNYE